jgi:hypothetical protein
MATKSNLEGLAALAAMGYAANKFGLFGGGQQQNQAPTQAPAQTATDSTQTVSAAPQAEQPQGSAMLNPNVNPDSATNIPSGVSAGGAGVVPRKRVSKPVATPSKTQQSSAPSTSKASNSPSSSEEGMANYVPRRQAGPQGRSYSDSDVQQMIADDRARNPKYRASGAVENVYPEQYLVGGGAGAGLKGVNAAAKSLANRGAQSGSRALAEMGTTPVTYLGKSGARRIDKEGQALLEYRGADKAAISNSRAPNISGPSGQRNIQYSPADTVPLTEADWAGGAVGYKRGGKPVAKKTVKRMATGGLATSASRRGDGIASKGKTKGKIY